MNEPSKIARDDLIALVKTIRDAQDLGRDYSQLLAELKASVAFPDVHELLIGDYPVDYIVDYSLQWQAHWPKLTREEMLTLVTRVVECAGTEAELDILTLMFNANCVHPAKEDLIYYPDEYFQSSEEPTPEEIVEKALAGE